MQRTLGVAVLSSLALILGACADSSADDPSELPGTSGESDDETGTNGDGDGDPEPVDFGPVRGDLVITSVEVSQSIVQPVFEAGAEVSAVDYQVPLVKNRYTIVRALWDTPEGWTPRPLTAKLTISLPDGTEVELLDYQTETGTPPVVDSESTPSDLFSGFFWRIDPELVVPGMRYQIAIVETAPADAIPASTVATEYPSAPAELPIQPDDVQIRIALVGVNFNYGGCVSDTSVLPEDELEALRAGFEAWNGVETNAVIIDTSLSVDIDYSVSGVPALLGVVGQIRGQLAESIPDAFFYILWDDCSPFAQGILGIAPVNNDPPEIGDAATRYAAGLWNPNDVRESVNTAVHEIGHNQGAPHAPCGVGNDYDPEYPHGGASIGIRGLDPLDGQMYSPNSHTDFMSYCRPYWVSDYRWNKSFNHQRIITSWGAGAAPSPDSPAVDGYAGAVLVGLILPGSETQWWINTREHAPRLDPGLEVELELGGAVVSTAGRIKELPDLPGAKLVEVPLTTGVDADVITGIRVHGLGVEALSVGPAIRDHRGLKFRGTPFSRVSAH